MKVRNLYTNGKCLFNKELFFSDGKISAIKDYIGQDYDFEHIAPAWVDVHLNGGEKFHFTANPTIETLEDIENAAKKSGTSYVLPALITSSTETILEGINVVKAYLRDRPTSKIMGLHLEGPFISEKKRGAHLAKYIQKPSEHILEKLINHGQGILKMMTIAPEHFTDHQIKMLLDAGIKVSLGHSDCSFRRAMEAFDLGVDSVTHLFNAMSPFHHREPGLVGAALATPHVFTPVIPDGVHASYDSIKLALKLKHKHLYFISDALFLNHKKKDFTWDEFDAKLINHQYINSDGNLAGSNITLAEAIKNATEHLSLSLENAIEKATYIPAKLFNLNAGEISVGKEATFCTFNSELTSFNYLEVK